IFLISILLLGLLVFQFHQGDMGPKIDNIFFVFWWTLVFFGAAFIILRTVQEDFETHFTIDLLLNGFKPIDLYLAKVLSIWIICYFVNLICLPLVVIGLELSLKSFLHLC